jgi:hypothetical protein
LSEDSSKLWTVRKFVEGTTLAEGFANPPGWWKLPVKVLAIAGIARGLGFAHSMGLVHQKLTPENIIIDYNYQIQITDFAAQKAGEEWSPKEDLRSFGTLLFRIMMDRCPTDAASAGAEALASPDVPAWVSDVINTCLGENAELLVNFPSISVGNRYRWFEHIAQFDPEVVIAYLNEIDEFEASWDTGNIPFVE